MNTVQQMEQEAPLYVPIVIKDRKGLPRELAPCRSFDDAFDAVLDMPDVQDLHFRSRGSHLYFWPEGTCVPPMRADAPGGGDREWMARSECVVRIVPRIANAA